MAERSYNQFCGLSGALDLVGERWTLLVVRELMTGPKRYTDIVEALEGIGTSLLAQRLKRLESAGVVERHRLGPPVASMVYQLTAAGEELGDALMPLVAWGLRHALPAAPTPEMRVEPHWTLLTLIRAANPEALQGLDASFEFEVEGRTTLLSVRDGQAKLAPAGSVSRPDARVRLQAATVAAIGSGRTSIEEAVLSGDLEFEGDLEAIGALTLSISTENH